MPAFTVLWIAIALFRAHLLGQLYDSVQFAEEHKSLFDKSDFIAIPINCHFEIQEAMLQTAV